MGEKKAIFLRADSVRQFTLSDILHKDLTLNSGEQKLQAISLKAGCQHRKVKFEMSRYSTTNNFDVNGLTVLLSIGEDLHMSCSMSGDKAVLELEKCSVENLREICKTENMDRFLFIKRTKALSLTSFESLKCPGWFISTSSDERDQSVDMCKADDESTCCFRVTANHSC